MKFKFFKRRCKIIYEHLDLTSFSEPDDFFPAPAPEFFSKLLRILISHSQNTQRDSVTVWQREILNVISSLLGTFKYFGHILLFYINIATCIPLLMDVDRPCFPKRHRLQLRLDYSLSLAKYFFPHKLLM